MDVDGDVDLLNITSTRLQWHPNEGNGTFAEPLVLNASSGGTTLALFEDLDGDGLKDIVATCMVDSTVSWFRGLPDQQFAERAVLAEFDGTPHRLQVVDVDGDLDLDLVAGFTQTTGPEGRWWRNQGGLTFDVAESLYTTPAPFPMNDIVIADVDNNLTRDAVIITGNRVLIRINSGTGYFAPQELASAHIPGVSRVAMVDLDGDSDLDMVLMFGQSVVIYANNGSGTFAPAGTALTGLVSLRGLFVAELVENGAPELVVFDDTGAFGHFVVIMVGPDLTLSSIASLSVPESGASGAAGDFNGDGLTDLLHCGNGAMGYYPQTAPGTFGDWPVFAYTSVSWPLHVTLGEVNGDEHLDIVISGLGGVEQFLGDGTTNFGPRRKPVPLPWTRAIAAIDDDADGLDEVFVCFEQANGGIKRLENTDGVLAVDQTLLTSPTTVQYMGEANVDDSGIDDLIYARTSEDLVGVLYRVGTGAYLNVPTGTYLQDSPTRVFAADMDGDGYKDLVRDVTSTTSDIQWHPNNTIGAFPPATPTGAVLDASMELVAGFAVGRLNDDPYTDVVASINDGTDRLVLLFNNGDGSAWNAMPLAQDMLVHDLQIADLDQNGRNDIIGLIDDDHAPWIWMATGDGTFASGVQLDSVLTEVYAIAIGDLDADGDPDILATGAGGGSVLWYENTSGVFTNDPVDGARPASISAYPNPASGTVSIALADVGPTVDRIAFIAADGRTVLDLPVAMGDRTSLDIRMLPSGTYAIVVYGDGIQMLRRMLVVFADH